MNLALGKKSPGEYVVGGPEGSGRWERMLTTDVTSNTFREQAADEGGTRPASGSGSAGNTSAKAKGWGDSKKEHTTR